MSTQRYISTSFWDDEWVHKLDPSEKLMYMYLMTNPLTNIAGVYKLSENRIGYDTGFNENTIRHIMEKFEKAGKAFRNGEYVSLPSWPKHQKWQTKESIKSGIISILDDLDIEIIKWLVSTGYKFDMGFTHHPPIIPPSSPHQPTYYDSDSDTNSDSDSDTDKKESPEIPAIPSKPKRVKKEKEEKKTYGAFKNVFLSDTEYNALKEAYTETVVLAGIEAVSKYVQGNSGKNYSNFNKVMLSWGIEAGKEAIQSGKYKPIQKQKEYVKQEKQVCPKCGKSVEFGQCVDCGIFVGLDGKEVIL